MEKTYIYLYQAIILPLIRYASPLFAKHTNNTWFKKINAIHNDFVRKSVGALNSTPIEYIHILADKLNLEEFLQIECANFFSKLIRLNDFNPLKGMKSHWVTHWIKKIGKEGYNQYDLLIPERRQNLDNKIKKKKLYYVNHPMAYISATIAHTMTHDFQYLEFYSEENTNKVTPYYKPPPIKPDNLMVDTSEYSEDYLPNWYKKGRTNLLIGTDGSVTENKGGFGAIIFNMDKITFEEYKIPQSIFTYSTSCELGAIKHIVQTVTEKQLNIWPKKKRQKIRALIVSDSLPSLKWLDHSWYTQDETNYEMLNEIYHAIQQCPKIHWTMKKIKAHIGHDINEWADQLAKEGADFHPTRILYPYKYATLKSIKNDNKKRIKSRSKQYKNRFIHNRPSNDFFKKYKINADNPFKIENEHMRIIDLQFITQLRTQHVLLNEYKFKYKMAETDICPNCDKKESVQHFMMECPEYDIPRNKLFNRIHKNYPNKLDDIQLHHILFPDIPTRCTNNKFEQEKYLADRRNYRLDILKQLIQYIKETQRFKKEATHLQLYINFIR